MTNILRPRNLRGILGETFKIYARNFLRLSAIVAIVEVSVVLLQGIMSHVKIESPVLFILSSIVAAPLMGGALIHAVSEQYFRQTIGIGRAYRFAWRRSGALLGATILTFLAIAAILIIAIGIAKVISSEAGSTISFIFAAPGFCAALYLSISWVFIYEAALLEGLGPIAALSRSSALVKGNWWRVWGIMLVLGIITSAITAIFGKLPEAGTAIGSILSTPILVIGNVLLYYDLRVRKEGYSLESLAGEIHIKPELSYTKAWEELSTKAFTLYQQGQYSEAGEIVQEALKAAEEALGPDHLDVATILSNLASLYIAQGKYSESEHLYKRTLTIREKTLGPDHPDVVSVLENMVELYKKIGKEDEAERLEKRAKGIDSKNQ